MKGLGLVIALVLAGTVVAQTPPPPPPAAIFKAPAAEKIVRYHSTEDAFAAEFPAEVTVSQEKVGQFSIRNYQAKVVASTTRLTVYDFGLDAREAIDRKAFLDDLRSELLRPRGASVIVDSEMSDSVHELVSASSSGMVRETTRIVFSDQRIYRLSVDITNWHILDESKKLEYNREVSRFFASFRFGEKLDSGKLPFKIGVKSDDRLEVTLSPDGVLPSRSDWKSYSYDNGRFKVSLPAEPEVEVAPMEFGIVKTSLYTYTSEGPSQLYVFGFMNFGLSIQDEAEISGFLDSWQEGLVESLTEAKVTAVDEVVNGRSARHIIAENSILRFEAYVYFIDGRMAQLVVATPSDESDETKDENRVLTKRFFESFVYSELDKAREPVSMPGTMETDEARLYNDDTYGFSLTLPKSWWRVDKAELSRGAESNVLKQKGTNATGRKSVDESTKNTEILLTAVGFDNENGTRGTLAIGVELFPSMRLSTKSIATASFKNFITNLGYKPVLAPTYKTVNGTGFYIFEMTREFNGLLLNQRFYMRKHKGKMFEIVLTENDPVILKQMEESLETLTFAK